MTWGLKSKKREAVARLRNPNTDWISYKVASPPPAEPVAELAASQTIGRVVKLPPASTGWVCVFCIGHRPAFLSWSLHIYLQGEGLTFIRFCAYPSESMHSVLCVGDEY